MTTGQKWIADSARNPGKISCNVILALFLVILITPTFVFYTFGTTSQAPGVIIINLVIALLAIFRIIPFKADIRFTNSLIVTTVILMMVMAHGLVALQIQNGDLNRLLQSAGIAAVSLFGTSIVAVVVFEADEKSIKVAITGTLIFLLMIALFGALRLAPYPPAIATSNPIFPYNEPSHLALALAPVSLAAAILSRGWRRLAIFISLLFVAFFLRSMSTLVISLLVASVTIPIRLLMPAALVVLIIFPYLDLSYFLERSDFSVHNTNLSNLVYLQGWELMYDSLVRSNGWGIGFQQLGIGQFNSPTANLVYYILGNDTNIRDGSFTFSKFVSEFGLIGIIIMCFYVYIAVKSAIILRLHLFRVNYLSNNVVIARSFVVASLVEFFVRGIGYFSPTIFLLISSLIYLKRKNELLL